MKFYRFFTIVFVISLVACTPASKDSTPQNPRLEAKEGFNMAVVEKGYYLVEIASCNDCHTEGYAVSGGNIPVKQWLTGSSQGFSGPWGTTYGANLRLFVDNLTQEQWVEAAKNLKSRPPMPWLSLNAMTEEDLQALYQFISYLGPSGEPAPDYMPPEQN